MRTRTQLNSFHTPIVAEKHGKFIFLIADFYVYKFVIVY